MNKKLMTAVLGTAIAMVTVSGCSKEKVEETEIGTLIINNLDESGDSSSRQPIFERDLVALFNSDETELEETVREVIETETKETETISSEEEIILEASDETEMVFDSVVSDEQETELAIVDVEEVQTETETLAGENTEIALPSETLVEVETETIKETETEVMTELATEAETETETELVTEVETETETELITETESELITETETELVTEAETEMETEPVTEAETVAAAETEVEASSEYPKLMIVADRVNVRSESNTDSDVKATLSNGGKVVVVAEENDWSEICFEDSDGFTQGYIKTEFLANADKLLYVKEAVNVRSQPSTEAERLGELAGGDTVISVEKQGDWYEFLYQNGEEVQNAFVNVEFVEERDAYADADHLISAAEEMFPELKAPLSDLESAAIEETESIEEAATEAATEAVTEAATEAVTEAATEAATEAVTEADTEVVTEAATEADTEIATEVATEESENETDLDETESLAEETIPAITVDLTDGPDAQFELAKAMVPDAKRVGVIYTSETADQIENYTQMAYSYNLGIRSAEIEDVNDIDLYASTLVGGVDCIICLDDPTVNEVLKTICAYADEVEIPVIGCAKEQLESGAIAAFEKNTLYWNKSQAKKLKLDTIAALDAKFEAM